MEIRKFHESPKKAWNIEGNYSPVHPKGKFWTAVPENHKKLAAKHSLEKPILLIFVKLSKILFSRLQIVKLPDTLRSRNAAQQYTLSTKKSV